MEIVDSHHDVYAYDALGFLPSGADFPSESPEVRCLAIFIVVGFEQADAICCDYPDASGICHGTGQRGEGDAHSHATLYDGGRCYKVSDAQCRPGGFGLHDRGDSLLQGKEGKTRAGFLFETGEYGTSVHWLHVVFLGVVQDRPWSKSNINTKNVKVLGKEKCNP
ncbi:hypothetical protein SDC9_115920 [bioreactor metagenome]|uniref:Uncharacterized protein n=1 Tax=bioreactor metagenome TaxID=1076179 RepID=A0A645C0X4_9ZZZZ